MDDVLELVEVGAVSLVVAEPGAYFMALGGLVVSMRAERLRGGGFAFLFPDGSMALSERYPVGSVLYFQAGGGLG